MVVNPMKEWRRRNSVEYSSRWIGEHAGYDNTPLPRLTWKAFGMGILVSMGKSCFFRFAILSLTMSRRCKHLQFLTSFRMLIKVGKFLFGYDTGMISGFLGMEDFLRRFGMRHADGTPYFSNVRSGLIVALLSIGTLFGALTAAPIADWIGRKKSIMGWVGILCVGIIVQITSTDKWYQIMMGRFVCGLGVGALSLLVPMYQVSSKFGLAHHHF